MTADNTVEVRKRALSYGAIDFVTSPFDRVELELRIRNHLRARRLALELAALAGDPEERARLAQDTLDGARMEVLEHLAHAAEFRDGENPLHTWRAAAAVATGRGRRGLRRPRPVKGRDRQRVNVLQLHSVRVGVDRLAGDEVV